MENIEKLREADLAQMKAVDVRTIDRESLMDIRKVQMDKNLPKSEQFADFLKQIRNLTSKVRAETRRACDRHW